MPNPTPDSDRQLALTEEQEQQQEQRRREAEARLALELAAVRADSTAENTEHVTDSDEQSSAKAQPDEKKQEDNATELKKSSADQTNNPMRGETFEDFVMEVSRNREAAMKTNGGRDPGVLAITEGIKSTARQIKNLFNKKDNSPIPEPTSQTNLKPPRAEEDENQEVDATTADDQSEIENEAEGSAFAERSTATDLTLDTSTLDSLARGAATATPTPSP